MSLSYRKARSVPSGSKRGSAYRVTGSARGTTYPVSEPDQVGQPGTAGPARAAQPATAGTSAVRLETLSGSHNDEAAGGFGTTTRMRQDNVVELFPGASTSTPEGDRGNWLGRLRYAEAGMATAEYAIATLAAVGFAGLLVVILRSDEVRGFLMTIIEQALTLG